MGLSDKRVHIFLGTGGVGKTTLSSLYAISLSKKAPLKKIKLITIDPSKRLKDYFEMTEESEDKNYENLTVSMRKREELLKEFIRESYNGDDKKVEKIYENKIFLKLIDGLSVSQEFTSLYEIYKSKHDGYDCLVIDTPPLQNAGAFLNGANELEGLFSSSLMKFFMPPTDQGMLYRLFHKAQKTSFEVLSKLTGVSFVKELSEFFITIETLRPKIIEVILSAKKTLNDESEIFCVCNHNELSLAGLKVSLEGLSEQGLVVKKSYINKYDENMRASKETSERLEELFKEKKENSFSMIDKFKKEPLSYRDLLTLGEGIEF